MKSGDPLNKTLLLCVLIIVALAIAVFFLSRSAKHDVGMQPADSQTTNGRQQHGDTPGPGTEIPDWKQQNKQPAADQPSSLTETEDGATDTPNKSPDKQLSSEQQPTPDAGNPPTSYPVDDAEKYFLPPEERRPGHLGGPPPMPLPQLPAGSPPAQ